MLINPSYFTAGFRHIQSATYGSVSNEVNTAIMQYVEDLQPSFLIEMLGDKVGANVHNYIIDIDNERAEINYDFEAICDRLKESFADYVFFFLIRDSNHQATITGVYKAKNANTHVSPINLQVSAWNRMVDKNRQFVTWLNEGYVDIKEIVVSPHLLRKINRFNL